MTTKTYQVPNISCGHCVATIERELKHLEGVIAAKADLDTKHVTVEVQQDTVLPEVEQTMAEIGYPVI